MQRKKKRRMRCPYCNSINTKKNGRREITPISFDRRSTRKVQRYKCNGCNRTFSNRRVKKKRYTENFHKEIVRMHVEERLSFRLISKRLKERFAIKVSAGYLCNMLNDMAKFVKSSKQIKEQYSPKWEGYLTVDDKTINVKGENKISLIAVDKSGDTVHEELLDYQEQGSYDEFFRFIKDHLDYPFKVVISDLDKMLEKSIKTVLPSSIVHQKCVKHAIDAIKRALEYLSRKRQLEKLRLDSEQYEDKINQKKLIRLKDLETKIFELEEILKMVRLMLYSTQRAKSNQILRELKARYQSSYPEVFALLKRHIDGLLEHQKDQRIPKTNNFAENKNKQLKRRLKTIEAFQKQTNAYNYLILLCNYLRFKPYTDCRKNRRICNGKSPLELCGVKLKEKDWIKNSLNLAVTSNR